MLGEIFYTKINVDAHPSMRKGLFFGVNDIIVIAKPLFCDCEWLVEFVDTL